MKRRPGPKAGRAEGQRRAKAIAIWTDLLLRDQHRADPLYPLRSDPRQLKLPFDDEPPRRRERRHSGPTKSAGAPPASWQDRRE